MPIANEAPDVRAPLWCAMRAAKAASRTQAPHECPRTATISSDADDALAVAGDGVERQLLAEQQEQQRDQQHAGGVPDAPLQTGPPLPAIAIGGERRDGGQVIGPREHVEQAGRETREKRKHE